MKKASRGRGLRVGIAGAAAALATMAFGIGSAQAQVPFQAELDNAYLKTGAFPNPGLDILTPGAGPPVVPNARIQGTVTPGTPPAPSTFTVPAGCNVAPGNPPDGFCFPSFSGTVLGGAVGVQVALESLQVVNGTVDSTTGALSTTSSNFKATLTLDFTPDDEPPDPLDDVCEVTPIPMAFNTTQPFPSPYAGDPFTVDSANITTDALDDGAMVTTWATLPAATPVPPTTSCSVVDSLTGGRGGLWIADNIAAPVINAAPPPPPSCANTPSLCPPTPKKCKKGQKLKKGKCVKAKKKKKKKK